MQRVLARPGVPALDRLLQAIVASDLDGIDRVLDDRLATHIDQLLAAEAPAASASLGTNASTDAPHPPVAGSRTAAMETPLATFAARWPVVTAATLDEAVSAFRAVLAAALNAAPDGCVRLTGPDDAPDGWPA